MKKEEKIPEFNSLEEEKKYWEERAKASGRWTKNKPQKRSSFLAVRLTGEEITKLRDAAAKQGTGLSTFARQAVINAIEGNLKKTISLTQALELLTADISETERKRLTEIYDSIAVPSLSDPILLFWNKKMMDEATAILARSILASRGITVDNAGSEIRQDGPKELKPGDPLSLTTK